MLLFVNRPTVLRPVGIRALSWASASQKARWVTKLSRLHEKREDRWSEFGWLDFIIQVQEARILKHSKIFVVSRIYSLGI